MSEDATVTMPISADGALVRFDDCEAMLRYDPESATASLGDLEFSSAPVAIAPVMLEHVPVIVLAGQSNASLPGMDHALYEPMTADGGAFEMVKLAIGSTSLFPAEDRLDWDPETGRLFPLLVKETRIAIANVVAQGQIPEIELLWVQGEIDRNSDGDVYAEKLAAFIADFRAAIGVADARVTISLLKTGPVRDAQIAVAEALFNVVTVESLQAAMMDKSHYTPEAAADIALDFLSQTTATTPAIDAYDNLLADTRIVVSPTLTKVVSALYGSIVFHETTNRYDIEGGAGADDIVTGDADDLVRTVGGADKVHAGGGDDQIVGGYGNDILNGGAGNDMLQGDWGDDRLFGGRGDDILYGGAGTGADILTGGDGADRFLYMSFKDTLSGAYDVIADFTPGDGDRIDLAAIDAAPATEGDDSFAFIGGEAFSGVAGELQAIAEGSGIWLQGDVTGDAVADFRIRLDGIDAIAAADIIL